jgi:hypothetical protein
MESLKERLRDYVKKKHINLDDKAIDRMFNDSVEFYFIDNYGKT